jgi:AcrR family transcriptional regulator
MARRFQRARKPEEKEVRRQAILKAARRLMREGSVTELSLSELARQSGVSKPNIYRYFESREEVLLQVLIEEIGDLTDRIESELAKVPVGDTQAAARVVASAFAAQPKLCELVSIVSSVLERNISAEAIATAKRALQVLTARNAQAMHARLPAIPLEDCAWSASTIATHVAGLWPGANPGKIAGEVLARPEFAGMKQEFERDLTRVTRVLLAGLAR